MNVKIRLSLLSLTLIFIVLMAGCSSSKSNILVKNTENCTDSENGTDQFIKGTTKFNDLSKTDSCKNATNLIEYSCGSEGIHNISIICDNKCKLGACIRPTTTITSTIKTITTNRINTTTKPEKIITTTTKQNSTTEQPIPIPDYNIINDLNTTSQNSTTEQIIITQNYQNTTHNLNTINNPTCTDSDGGKNYYVTGTAKSSKLRISIEDHCQIGRNSSPQNILIEYFCDNSGDLTQEYLQCPNGCSKGMCLNSTEKKSIISNCTDSDGGKNYYLKGTLRTGDGVIYSDFCKDNNTTTKEKPNGKYLNEMYCVDDKYNSTSYICPNGCSNGACLNKTIISSKRNYCIDSDGNNNNISGTVTITEITQKNGISTTKKISHTDICTSNRQQVKEYTCNKENTSYALKNYPCANGCSNGACIKPNDKINKISLANCPQIGAIRWDTWNPEYAANTSEIDLKPTKYHFRLPFFATIGNNSININGNTQEVMDEEIDYAAYAGIDYWAFLAYNSATGFDYGVKNYLNSSKKNKINFAMIINLGNLINPDKEFINDIINLIKESTYQRTNGRPIVYLMNNNLAPKDITNQMRDAINEFKEKIKSAINTDPYFVMMASDPDVAKEAMTAWDLDAITSYGDGRGVYGQEKYTQLTKRDLLRWEKAKNINANLIPNAIIGWDPRPRIDALNNTLLNSKRREDWLMYKGYYLTPTPKEVAKHMNDTIDWIKKNPNNAQSNNMIIYAWNEYDEGGWISPTIEIDNTGIKVGINTERIEAIRNMLGDTCPEKIFEQNSLPAKKYRLFIIAGQSNAVSVRSDVNYLNNIHNQSIPSNVKFYWMTPTEVEKGFVERNDFISTDYSTNNEVISKRFGPEVGLAHALSDQYPNEDIVIVKYAYGGTNSCQWKIKNPADNNYNQCINNSKNIDKSKEGGYLLGNNLVTHLKNDFPDDKYNYTAFIWFQGEADVSGVYNYPAHIKELFETIKTNSENSNLMIILTLISSNDTIKPNINKFREIQKKFTSENKNIYSVDSYDLTRVDEWHLDSKSIVRVGECYAQAIKNKSNVVCTLK